MTCYERLIAFGYVLMLDKPQPEPSGPGSAPLRHGRRLVGLLAVGVVLLGAAALYLYLTFSLPVGEGPAGPPVPRAAFSHPWTARPVVLVGLGDSVTAGFGARRGYTYFDRLVANPPDEFPDMKGVCLSAVFLNLRATNLSVSGTVSSIMSRTSYPMCLARMPKRSVSSLSLPAAMT